jgi:hypothetical protein
MAPGTPALRHYRECGGGGGLQRRRDKKGLRLGGARDGCWLFDAR